MAKPAKIPHSMYSEEYIDPFNHNKYDKNISIVTTSKSNQKGGMRLIRSSIMVLTVMVLTVLMAPEYHMVLENSFLLERQEEEDYEIDKYL
ncbi:MAG: hypothetical protein PGMFKBFP_02844 [Anaerolineales bacterium]|nr:hypothetical protein [Anaerolineales bacterium]